MAIPIESGMAEAPTNQRKSMALSSGDELEHHNGEHEQAGADGQPAVLESLDLLAPTPSQQHENQCGHSEKRRKPRTRPRW